MKTMRALAAAFLLFALLAAPGAARAQETVARGEFLSTIIRESGLNLNNIRFFKAPEVGDVAPDVSPDSPYAADIIIAGHFGVVENGKPFRPESPVTREEAAVMAVKALDARAGNLPVTQQYIVFKDEQEINSSNMASIQYACKLGLFKTEDSFRPRDNLTRPELAALIQAFKNILARVPVLDGDKDSYRVEFSIGGQSYCQGGLAYKMDASPFLDNGRALVPVRYLAIALGIPEDGITWSTADQSVTLVKEGSTISLAPGKSTMYVNERPVALDTAPVLRQGRVYLPARYVAEALGFTVQWDELLQKVLINP